MERRCVSRRELARRLAANHPKGVTPDTTDNARRAVRRYLKGVQVPLEPTQVVIAEAIGADPAELPSGDDEDEEDLATTLQALAIEHRDLSRRLERALKAAAV